MNEFSFSDVDAGDSRAAIDYLDAVSRISVADKDRTFAIQRLAPGMRVLDIGCGTGDDVRRSPTSSDRRATLLVSILAGH